MKISPELYTAQAHKKKYRKIYLQALVGNYASLYITVIQTRKAGINRNSYNAREKKIISAKSLIKQL